MTRRALLLLALAAACADDAPAPVAPEPGRPPPVDPVPRGEPAKVAFDHILVSFESARQSRSPRTRAAARRLAEQTYDAVRDGADWSRAKQEFSDDRAANGVALGPYVLTNFGVPHVTPEMPRTAYSKHLADRVFTLKVGEYALVPYDEKHCPYGYHILRRLR